MGANAVTIIVPMRLSDHGLSYTLIGVAMSMLAFGIVLVKPIVGRHSDLVGPKIYMLISLSLGCIILFLMSLSSSPIVYMVLNCFMGLGRGMFTSIASSYTVTISDNQKLGSSFGNLVGITTLFTCAGGVFAGILYPFAYGSIALFLVAVIYGCSFFITLKWLPDVKNSKTDQKKTPKILSVNLFKNMNKYIYMFGFIVFLQQFTTGPLWNTFVPLQFYMTFAFSSTFVGILMSLDEFVGSPTSFAAGKISDKIKDSIFLPANYTLAGISAVILFFMHSSLNFMLLFLITGCFVTCTQVVLPKAASGFMRSDSKGFEFAIISTCGALGEWLGNLLLGNVISKFSVNYVVLIFAVSYILISNISYIGLKKGAKFTKLC